MKYSLRNLMVAITLFCVVLGGRVACLRQMASFHEREAEACARQLGLDANQDPFGIMVITNSNVAPFYHEWRRHAELALEYRDASYRPWTLVNDWWLP